ncbi:MAG: heme o synthase [Deltaproteobacteria bacterium]|nr:heme o synthase [Deltaproteobacteria bacterium]
MTKPRIFVAITITAFMGMMLRPDFLVFSTLEIISLLVSTILACAGGAVLNHYFERKTDGLMNRTKNRPLVNADRTLCLQAFAFGTVLTVAGLAFSYLVLGWLSAFLLFLGFINYVLFYTLIFKHHSFWNVTVGGLSSSFAILAGDAAVTGQISTSGIILAVMLFFWNPVHFWNLAVLYQEDYKKAKIPMVSHAIGKLNTTWLILLHVLFVVVFSLMLGFSSILGMVYFISAAVAGLVLLGMNFQNLFDLSNRLFRRNFIFSNMYILIIFFGMVFDLMFNYSLSGVFS